MDKLEKAIKDKWRGVPTTKEQADAILLKPVYSACIACGSHSVIPIIRQPTIDWRVHCNHCGIEYSFAVMMNRNAWRILAKEFERFIRGLERDAERIIEERNKSLTAATSRV